MTWHKFVLPMLIAASVASAQTTPTVHTGSPSTIPGTTTPGRRSTSSNRQEPCWQVAGVSKAAIQQRQALAKQVRREVESVCANSALSVEQKREQIHEIRQREHQQVEALITPQQQEAIRACQQGRGTHAGGGGHVGGHAGGPCGSIPGFEHESEPGSTEPIPKD